MSVLLKVKGAFIGGNKYRVGSTTNNYRFYTRDKEHEADIYADVLAKRLVVMEKLKGCCDEPGARVIMGFETKTG